MPFPLSVKTTLPKLKYALERSELLEKAASGTVFDGRGVYVAQRGILSRVVVFTSPAI